MKKHEFLAKLRIASDDELRVCLLACLHAGCMFRRHIESVRVGVALAFAYWHTTNTENKKARRARLARNSSLSLLVVSQGILAFRLLAYYYNCYRKHKGETRRALLILELPRVVLIRLQYLIYHVHHECSGTGAWVCLARKERKEKTCFSD